MKSRQASAAATSTSARRRRLAGAVHGLARAQQRLRRDARPVGAFAADQLALDDGDAQPARGQRGGAVLAGRPAAEDDHVVVAHVGSSVAGLLARPCTRRTSRASSRPPRRCASRARRGRPRPAAAPRPGPRPRRTSSSAGSIRPGQPGGDLLQQPAVAVRVAERGERAVAGAIGRGPADPTARASGSELRARRPRVEHLADLGTAGGQLVAGGLDVGDDQVQALRRAGRGRGDARCRTGPSTPSRAG